MYQSYEIHVPTLLDFELQSTLRKAAQRIEWVWRLAAWLRTPLDADETDESGCAAEGHVDARKGDQPVKSSQTGKLSHFKSRSGLAEIEKIEESEAVFAQNQKHSSLQECSAEDGSQ